MARFLFMPESLAGRKAAFVLSLSLAALVVVGLIQLGASSAGISFPTENFPLKSRSLPYLPYFWPVFSLGLLVLVGTISFYVHAANELRLQRRSHNGRFPWWGWLSLGCLLFSWILAWTRFPFVSAIQQHTFVLLWSTYILFANAVVFYRSGKAPLITHTRIYLTTIPLSAVFWWLFEYINCYSQNWSYQHIEGFSFLDFSLFASLSFSTVLPAVWVTRDLLQSWIQFDDDLDSLSWLTAGNYQRLLVVLVPSCLVILYLLPQLPNELYPFVWIAPMIIVEAVFALSGYETPLARGMQHRKTADVVFWSLAGLACGALWELWNYWSLAKWLYHTPYVEQLRIFEMPLLGYLGYLPFGLLCGTVIEALSVSQEASKVATATFNGPPPQHVAIIMDGNGRWATSRGLPRLAGHRKGVEAIQGVIESSLELGVRYITLFAFSTENWKRDPEEVGGLMELFEQYLNAEVEKLLERGIRLRVVGQRERLSPQLIKLIEGIEQATVDCSRLEVILAISYGGRDDIVQAIRGIAQGLECAELSASEITESLVAQYLHLSDVPDPDVLIRTGREQRISNFLLWQLAYAELIFRPSFWPDFTPEEYGRCLREFSNRKRRYGLTP